MDKVSHASPAVSVIIPIYNIAPYIRECVESLFNQTLENIEYIFIDDASTDESVEILESVVSRFPNRASQVKLIRHKENKGISYSRNLGTQLATGEYLIHCDSDDVVEIDAYSELYKCAKASGADMVISAYSVFDEKTCSTHLQGEGSLSNIEFLERLSGLRTPGLHGALWNKLIKKELWRDIRFPENISFCEDVSVLFQIMIKNPGLRIEVVPKSLYKYRQRENSLVTLFTPKRAREVERLIDIFETYRIESDKELHDSIDSKIIGFLYRILIINGNTEEFYKKYRKYAGLVSLNKELNIIKRQHLNAALHGRFLLADLIKLAATHGKRIVKLINS